MPRHSRRTTRKKSYRGGSIINWIKTKALPFVKKHQLVSKGLKWVGKTIKSPALSTLGAAVGHTGYGRRRLRMGRGLRVAGGALRL